MLVGGVGIDLVDDDLDAERMGPGDQGIKVGKRAEDRIDVAIAETS
jgi:hypothetical protein